MLFLSRGEAEETRRFASESNVHVPIAIHPDGALPDKYKARVSPFAFLIDGEGIIRAKGLANNRSHLEMLLDMARKEIDRAGGQTGRNGATAEEKTTQRA